MDHASPSQFFYKILFHGFCLKILPKIGGIVECFLIKIREEAMVAMVGVVAMVGLDLIGLNSFSFFIII